MRARMFKIVATAVLATLCALPMRASAADVTVTQAGSMPQAGHYETFWSGSLIYAIQEYTGRIYAFNPATGASMLMNGSLPPGGAVEYSGVVWMGNEALIFDARGGKAYRYDPAGDTVTFDGTFPARSESAVAWDGTDVYLFGGWTQNPTTDIVKYVPSQHSGSIVASMPLPRGDASAVYVAPNFYIFGGRGTGGGSKNEIMKFDPSTQITLIVGTLPKPLHRQPAVLMGTDVYLIGGSHGNCNCDDTKEIVRFDTTTESATITDGALPIATENMGASAIDPSTIYAFGGCGYGAGASCPMDQIVKIQLGPVPPPPPPGAPSGLIATLGLPGEINLVWSPAVSSAGPIAYYNIYRGTASGMELMYWSVSGVTQFTDSVPSGSTWFYFVTAVDVTGQEGPASNEVFLTAL